MHFSAKVFSVFKRDLLLFITNLVSGVVIARTLGPSALGIWLILSMVPTYAESIGRTKVDIASVYFIGQKIFEPKDIIFNLNLIALFTSGIVLTVICVQFDGIYNSLFKDLNFDYRLELKVLLILIPLQYLLLNYSYFHLALENLIVYNRIVIIQSWANIFVTLPLLMFTDLGVWALISGAIFATSLALMYGWMAAKQKIPYRGGFNKKIIIALIRSGGHFYLGGIFGQLQQTGGNFLSAFVLPPAHISFLNQGQAISKLLNRLIDPVNSLLFPRMSGSKDSEAVHSACVAFRLTCVLLIPAAIMLTIFVKPLIQIMYGDAFLSSASVVYFVLPGVLFSGLGCIFISFFQGTGRANLVPKIQLLPVFIQLGLSWIFLNKWGLEGVALGISIGLVIYGLALTITFVRVAKISPAALVPRSSDFFYVRDFFTNQLRSLLRNNR